MWPIPWDLDQTVDGPGQFVLEIKADWNDLDAPCVLLESDFLSPHKPPACDPLIRGWARRNALYRATVEQLLNGPFAEEAVEDKLQRWETQIAPVVEEGQAFGHTPTRAAWAREMEAFRGILEERRQVMATSISK